MWVAYPGIQLILHSIYWSHTLILFSQDLESTWHGILWQLAFFRLSFWADIR